MQANPIKNDTQCYKWPFKKRELHATSERLLGLLFLESGFANLAIRITLVHGKCKMMVEMNWCDYICKYVDAKVSRYTIGMSWENQMITQFKSTYREERSTKKLISFVHDRPVPIVLILYNFLLLVKNKTKCSVVFLSSVPMAKLRESASLQMTPACE